MNGGNIFAHDVINMGLISYIYIYIYIMQFNIKKQTTQFKK